ncbi:unnamed protein product [Closterium sp. NIES-65]|nr:unnamed protein product [Closterium sp. NIES-65]
MPPLFPSEPHASHHTCTSPRHPQKSSQKPSPSLPPPPNPSFAPPDVHEATSSAYTARPGEDDGTLLSPVQDYVAARELQKLAGIYAVYDGAGALQYVGYSRNIVVSLKGHRVAMGEELCRSGHRAAMGEELCSSVRVQVYRADSLLSRAVLDGERRRWLQELGQSESFMQTSSFAWWGAQGAQGAQVGAAAAAAAEGGELSDGERAEQEERRLRMRKAMGENLMDDEEYRRRVEGGETDGESDRRRMQLLQVREGGWRDGEMAEWGNCAIASCSALGVRSTGGGETDGESDRRRLQLLHVRGVGGMEGWGNGVVGWRDGGMEWWDGGMGGWSGGMEGWGDGVVGWRDGVMEWWDGGMGEWSGGMEGWGDGVVGWRDGVMEWDGGMEWWDGGMGGWSGGMEGWGNGVVGWRDGGMEWWDGGTQERVVVWIDVGIWKGESDGEGDTRRLQLLQLMREIKGESGLATEGDDWSSVIDGQTQETVSARGSSNGKPSRAAKGEARGATATEAATAQQGSGVAAPSAALRSAAPIVSPFARPGAAGTGAGGEAEEAEGEMELTVESADQVLDRVRPYLVADGGNVEVKAVENGVVILELQGACNTCPSSAATMKMGIERALQDAFGEKLKEVMQLGGVDNRLTLAAVENHLSQVLQPTLSKYGASASAVSLDLVKGFCEVRFEGPPPMAMGIQAALKDKFPEIRLVKLVS